MTASTANTKILIVEDHQMTLVGIKMLLEKEEGFSVAGTATDGLQAVELATMVNPEIILMDIGLPEMDGIEATQKIKEKHPNMKIIMLTSKNWLVLLGDLLFFSLAAKPNW